MATIVFRDHYGWVAPGTGVVEILLRACDGGAVPVAAALGDVGDGVGRGRMSWVLFLYTL
jgi:hypothetical protein